MPPEHLVVVAHPDDEVIFFGGVVQRLVRDGADVTVVCATGRFGDDWIDRVRARELQRAAELIGVRALSLGLEDAPGPLDGGELDARLAAAVGERRFDGVHTHGVLGEYGHPHHTAVCLAVHRAFADAWSLAGPFPAQRTLALGRDELARKRSVARRAYASQPFAAGWATAVERYHRPRECDAADVREAVRRLGEPVPCAELEGIPAELWRDAMDAWRARLSADGLDEVLGAARAHAADVL